MIKIASDLAGAVVADRREWLIYMVVDGYRLNQLLRLNLLGCSLN
jgi:hypothetical protein